ncbi:hypothetical protein D3C84_1004890 [compost metagenome]
MNKALLAHRPSRPFNAPAEQSEQRVGCDLRQCPAFDESKQLIRIRRQLPITFWMRDNDRNFFQGHLINQLVRAGRYIR